MTGSLNNQLIYLNLLYLFRCELSDKSSVSCVFLVQLKLKWNSLCWTKKKRWTDCHLMAKPVPSLTADRTGPWDTALTTTPHSSPSTTNPETMWRPPSVTSKIQKMDSKIITSLLLNALSYILTHLFICNLITCMYVFYDMVRFIASDLKNVPFNGAN